MNKIRYNPMLKQKAQSLRREGTIYENRLWYEFLRKHKRQFRRQKQFGRYIVDFYCSSAKLIIELDGKQHNEPDAVVHDRSRTAYLESLGYSILRIPNDMIEEDLEAVCRYIDKLVEKGVNKPSSLGKVARCRRDG